MFIPCVYKEKISFLFICSFEVGSSICLLINLLAMVGLEPRPPTCYALTTDLYPRSYYVEDRLTE